MTGTQSEQGRALAREERAAEPSPERRRDARLTEAFRGLRGRRLSQAVIGMCPGCAATRPSQPPIAS